VLFSHRWVALPARLAAALPLRKHRSHTDAVVEACGARGE